MEGYLLAVPEGKRTESKLAVQTKAIEMANYTITICSNENNFPKRYRWCLTNKIVDTAIEIMNDINTANSIYVSTKNDYELRREFQTKALAYTARLLGLMELAYVKFKLTETGKVIRLLTKENIKKRKRKLRKYKKLVNEGKMTRDKANQCYESWKAHARKGNSYKLLKRMDIYYENLWKE